MRAVATVLVLAALAVGCGEGSGNAGPGTSLTITVWPKGRNHGAMRTRTLRCDPAGGTLSRPGEACAALGRLSAPFAQVPANAVCIQIYGGPQEARVRGSYRGRRIDARFNRRDGCQIARWNRVRFLFT